MPQRTFAPRRVLAASLLLLCAATPAQIDPVTGATSALPIIPEANGGFGTSVAGIGTGLVARTGVAAYAARTLQAGANITISNPDGVAGNPVINGVPAAGTLIYYSVTANANGGLTIGGTCFMTSPGVACSGTEQFLLIADRAGTAKDLRCSAATGPGGGRTSTFTARQNGANTVLTCGMTATTCTDLTHTFAVAAGDQFSISEAEPLLSGTTRSLCSFVITN